MSIKISLLFLVTALCAAHLVSAQNKVQQKVPEKTRILFVLDGSGSMEALWGVNESRMDIAKKILGRLVDSLRVNPDIELALRVYGHRFTREANNCNDSKLEVPFGIKNHSAIISKIAEIRPRGVTPITNSLLQSANDFPAGPGYRNILILITDGIESCGSDPCAASVELQRKGVFLRPFIIGLGIRGGKVLECVGRYIDSQNENTFNQVLNESIETTFGKTTVSIDLQNGSNQSSESNLNVSFVNSMTRVSAYDFIHYRDKLGRPDSVEIDPVPGYDIVVNTLPQVVVRDINIKAGKHNLIPIAVPQGSLVVKPEARGHSFSILVRQKGISELLNFQKAGEQSRYLAGDYEVEVLTFPKRIFQVRIEPDKTKTITIPQPGLVNINTISKGYGSLFEILDTGESKWICHLDENSFIHSYNLLPGNYKISFRVRQAGGSKYTAIRNFEVKPGVTLNISMFN